jgi:hypothetical protein
MKAICADVVPLCCDVQRVASENRTRRLSPRGTPESGSCVLKSGTVCANWCVAKVAARFQKSSVLAQRGPGGGA